MISRARAFFRELWAPSVSSDLAQQKDLSALWAAYGGLRRLWNSPYLWVAVAAMIVLRPLWCGQDWTEAAISVLPNLLGFSIGAVAIILAAPSLATFGLLSEDGHPESYFMDLAARLVHFIIVQVIALGGIFVAKTYPTGWTNGVGFLLFAYAVLTAISAGLALFGIARLLNAAAAVS